MLSIHALLAPCLPLPDIWGEGALFAFSGFDGPTCSDSHFVLTLGQAPCELLIQTADTYALHIPLGGGGRVLAATGDVLAIDTPGGELLVTFNAWHTVVGLLPAGVVAELATLPPVAGADPRTPRYRPQRAAPAEIVVLRRAGDRFALAYGETPEIAAERAVAGLSTDLSDLVARRLAFYRRIPSSDSASETCFLRKCASVMKVNALAPEAAIRRRWSTPDRVPHQHMWLWDSVFHSFAMNRIDPAASWEYLMSVLEAQRDDGMIPHMMTVSGRNSEITQPPLLAWGIWENYRCTQDDALLAEAFPRLEAYLAWNLAHRDRNGNGLLEWAIEANERSRSGESGMDNSPRFDGAITLDAVDFSAYQAHDMACLARIADVLGRRGRVEFWRAASHAMSSAIQDQLWNAGRQFFCDRQMDGTFVPVRAVSGFMPLLLDDVPSERVDALERALRDPAVFGAAWPIPSAALDEPTWSTDLWRGATWINMNYMTIIGLERQGRRGTARWLRERTVALVREAYERHGVLFEFFDASGQRQPPQCDRKGPVSGVYDIRARFEVIRDYHWTAALCYELMHLAAS